MANAMMSEATPAATPTIEMTVMIPMTAWRRLARRYRAATKSSNCIEKGTGYSLTSARFHCSEVGAGSRDNVLHGEFRQQRRDTVAILAISIAEALLQLGVFLTNHDRPGDGRKYQQAAERQRSGGECPTHDFAEVAEIDGMPHLGSNTRDDQTLFV